MIFVFIILMLLLLMLVMLMFVADYCMVDEVEGMLRTKLRNRERKP